MKKIYFAIIFLLFTKLLPAQVTSGKKVSVNFNQAGIDAVVRELESQTGYHFYFDHAQFDSLKVTLQISDALLENVLNMAFNNTTYHYAIVPSSGEVFLTKGKVIRTQLASGYFNNTKTN